MFGGQHDEAHGRMNVTFITLSTLEEAFEMIGIVVLIHALTSYIGAQIGTVEIKIRPS